MKSNNSGKIIFSLLFSTLCMACGGSTVESPYVAPISKPNGRTLPILSGPNVLSLSVNGTQCGGNNSYPNKPCVAVTICAPGTSTCQTINDLLLDTGSVGLRIFKSVLNAPVLSGLTSVTVGGNQLATCVQFGDGTADWGSVKYADLKLGTEGTVTGVPIQVIDSTFASVPSGCGTPDVSPAAAGFNGILGVGLFLEDCGTGCASYANNNMYYTCTSATSGSSCTGKAVPLSLQVQNVVAKLSTDNNGILLSLPDSGLGGVNSLEGYLVLGVDTRSNNIPNGVTAFSADGQGQYTTSFNGTPYVSFVDSGSNALFFQGPVTDCVNANSSFSGWYCPSWTNTFSATTISSTATVEGKVEFQVGNTINLFSTPYNVFAELSHNGQFGSTAVFDWGLPFFVGRNVYLGFETKSSSLGSGRYWAY